jgi:hypothetical protein
LLFILREEAKSDFEISEIRTPKDVASLIPAFTFPWHQRGALSVFVNLEVFDNIQLNSIIVCVGFSSCSQIYLKFNSIEDEDMKVANSRQVMSKEVMTYYTGQSTQIEFYFLKN